MRPTLFAALVVAVAWPGVSAGQTYTGSSESRGYVEAVAQSAFGNVTSQSFGGEAGITISPGIQIFVEGGQVRDASTTDLGGSAQVIAGFLSKTQSGVSFQVKEPITFGAGGIRYIFPVTSVLQPYVLGGGGAARIKKDAKFLVSGSDITSNLDQFGVVLGTDLSGSETKPLLTLGGGVAWPLWQRLVVDFQYRYSRVFATGQGINVNRAGVGLGVRF